MYTPNINVVFIQRDVGISSSSVYYKEIFIFNNQGLKTVSLTHCALKSILLGRASEDVEQVLGASHEYLSSCLMEIFSLHSFFQRSC